MSRLGGNSSKNTHLLNFMLAEHSADSSTLQPGQPDLGLPASMAPQQLTHQVSQRRRRSELDIQASVATYPLVTGVPVGGPEGLQFLPDLPNTIQLWRSQHTLMLAWCASSVVLLLLFAPFFITTGLFLGAEVACILGIMASGVHLCKRAAADGESFTAMCAQPVLTGTVRMRTFSGQAGDMGQPERMRESGLQQHL